MIKNADEKVVVRVDPELKELIPGYLENREKDINAIQEALKKRDYKTIQKLSHTMKGSGGGYGFDDITIIGCSMEQAAKDEDSTEIKECLSELKAYLREIEIVYE